MRDLLEAGIFPNEIVCVGHDVIDTPDERLSAPDDQEPAVGPCPYIGSLEGLPAEHPAIPAGDSSGQWRRRDTAGFQIDERARGAVRPATPRGEAEMTGEVWRLGRSLGEACLEHAL
jgi:hypothetical protein